MVHGPSRSSRGVSLARRMRLDCVGDADLAETSERGADPLRVAHRVCRATPPKRLVLSFSGQVRPIRLCRSSKLLGLGGATRSRGAEGPMGCGVCGAGRGGSWPGRPNPKNCLTCRAALVAPTERIRASFAGFRKIRVPDFNPTRFGAPDSPRARASTDHGPWTMDHGLSPLPATFR